MIFFSFFAEMAMSWCCVVLIFEARQEFNLVMTLHTQTAIIKRHVSVTQQCHRP